MSQMMENIYNRQKEVLWKYSIISVRKLRWLARCEQLLQQKSSCDLLLLLKTQCHKFATGPMLHWWQSVWHSHTHLYTGTCNHTASGLLMGWMCLVLSTVSWSWMGQHLWHQSDWPSCHLLEHNSVYSLLHAHRTSARCDCTFGSISCAWLQCCHLVVVLGSCMLSGHHHWEQWQK